MTLFFHMIIVPAAAIVTNMYVLAAVQSAVIHFGLATWQGRVE